jgi:hypothetical protein
MEVLAVLLGQMINARTNLEYGALPMHSAAPNDLGMVGGVLADFRHSARRVQPQIDIVGPVIQHAAHLAACRGGT